MSLVQFFPKEIPAATRKAADPLMEADSVCRLLGDKGDDILNESSLAQMYSHTGRGAINPVLLCFVLALQYLEKLPDREAAKMVKVRIDWKYALRQKLNWTGFDYSSLCNFRKRLYKHGQEYALFQDVLQYLATSGYVKSQRQRTDATHILGAVERLSRLELVWETLRMALEALINADAKWTIKHLPATFVSEYSQRGSDFRLSKAQVEGGMVDAGRDGFWLLAQIAQFGPEQWQELPEMVTLREVLEQQFEQGHEDDASTVQVKVKIDATGDVISSPHDPSERYSRKGKIEWQGYKGQVTETVDGEFSIITDIAVHSAIEHDGLALPEIQQRLEQRGLPPEKQYVDGAYCNGKTLKSSAERGIDLRGFIGNYSRKPPGFRLEDFFIDLEMRRARCPAGKWATVFNPSSQTDVAFHVRFGKQCQGCRLRQLCTTEQRGRSLEISPYHRQLSARRREQAGGAFIQEMHARARIESTICELARRHGMRQSRYRGQHKLQLQAAFTAAAVNLKRLARHLTEGLDSFAVQFFRHVSHLSQFFNGVRWTLLKYSISSHPKPVRHLYGELTHEEGGALTAHYGSESPLPSFWGC